MFEDTNKSTGDNKILLIDGSQGGGSILRISLAFSILTKTPIRIINIRAKRKPPGLKAQHLQGVFALADFCNGKIKCAYLGSKEIEFYPGNEFKKELNVKISTAGSVGLVLYPLALASLATKELNVKINGGATFGKWAPPITFLENVTFEILRRIGIDVELNVIKHGFYPKGGALVEAKIIAKEKLKSLKLENIRELTEIKVFSIASKDLRKRNVAERQSNAFLSESKRILEEMLRSESPLEIEKEECWNMDKNKNKIIEEILEKVINKDKIIIKNDYVDSICTGSGIVACLRAGDEKTQENYILGSDALGEPGIRAEELGAKAAKDLLSSYFSCSTVDEHLADQIIPFLSIAGSSTIIVPRITEHIENSILLSKIFTNREIKIENKRLEIF